MFELTRQSAVPLVDQIVERVTKLIRHGQLPEGARIPSIRKLATLVGASPFTVVDAYDRLVARGVIESRAGRGFFVTKRRSVATTLPVIEALPDPGTDAMALASASLNTPSEIIAAGSGFLPTTWYAEALPSSVMTRLTHARRPQAWMPCPPQGLAELREQLAARLVQRGIAVGPANIVTTFGASQAFDLIARILFAPGDSVLVEDPGYFVLFEQLRAHHVKLIPVPRLANGPDIEALEAACRTHRPRAFFTQTLLQNPSGSNTDPAICHRVLSLAETHGFAVIEDDVYGDLYEGPGVRLAQIDGLRHVIYVGSFTKLMGPALRLGFVAADPAIVAQLVERKLLSVLSGSALLESLVSDLLDSGRFLRHTDLVKTRLNRMRRDARRALESAGIEFDESAGEGIFLWGRVPEALDVDTLVRRARDHSILLASGALFSPGRSNNQRLRFNAAYSAAPELVRFLTDSVRAAA
ncbi:MAG: PLP-dependent aminotransferase family protein [Gammaproteobacteria bacterium]